VTGSPQTVELWVLRSGTWSPMVGGASLAGLTSSITSFRSGTEWMTFAVAKNPDDPLLPEVLRWSGVSWESVLVPTLKQPGRSFDMRSLRAVDGLPVGNSAMLVGGNFRGFPWGIAHNTALTRDGQNWQAVWSPAGGILGVPKWCEEIEGPNPGERALLVAGAFSTAGLMPVSNAAVWNGNSWAGLSGYELSQASGMGRWHPDGQREVLLACQLQAAGQPVTAAIIRRRGTSTSLLPDVTYASGVVAIQEGVLNGSPAAFLAGGIGVHQDGADFGTLVAWDGATWHPLFSGAGVPTFYSTINWLAAETTAGDSTSILTLVGSPTTAIPDPKPWISTLRNGEWTHLGAVTGSLPAVNAVAWFDDGSGNGREMYAAGSFDTIDGVPAKNIAKRVAGSWTQVGAGFTSGAARGLRTALDDQGFQALIAWGNLGQSEATKLGSFARLVDNRWVPAGPDARVSPSGGEVENLAEIAGDGTGLPKFVALGSFFGMGYGASTGIAPFDGLGDRPSIQSVPTTTIRRATGQSVLLPAQVAGPAQSLRWHRAGVPLTDDARVSGASTTNLTISGLTATDQGAYTLVASGPCGSSESIAVQVRVCVDIVVDGVVNTRDLTRMLSLFGQSVGPGTQGDLDADADVDSADLVRLLGAFGRTCITN